MRLKLLILVLTVGTVTTKRLTVLPPIGADEDQQFCQSTPTWTAMSEVTCNYITDR